MQTLCEQHFRIFIEKLKFVTVLLLVAIQNLICARQILGNKPPMSRLRL